MAHAIIEYLDAHLAGGAALTEYEQKQILPEIQTSEVRTAYLLGYYRQMLNQLIDDIGQDNVRKLYAEHWPCRPVLKHKGE